VSRLAECSLAVLLVALGACRSKDAPSAAPAPSAAAAAAAAVKKPVDRLAPGELAPGDSSLFGLPLPRGMVVEGKFKDFAVANGRLSAEAVANYVRDHVLAEHVEIGAARTVFPSVRIKQGAPDRAYRVEVLQDGLTTRVVVRDITPRPAPKVDGVSAEELWRRAGFSRDGKPLNPKALE